MNALQHPRTRTPHTNRVFTTFVLSNFSLILSYTHSLLSPCLLFLLSFLFFSLVAHTQSLDIGDSRRGASMALAFSSTPLAPTELEDGTTHPSRPQLNFAWPRATRSAKTSLGPEQLARPRLYLAPSNSLGHDVDFTWPRATRSAMPPLLPATSNSLSHCYAIGRPQQLARPRDQSITLPIYLSRPRATRSVSDFFSCKLTPTPQRYRKFDRELPATSNSTSARSASLVISIDHVKPARLANMPWTSLPSVLPPLQVPTI